MRPLCRWVSDFDLREDFSFDSEFFCGDVGDCFHQVGVDVDAHVVVFAAGAGVSGCLHDRVGFPIDGGFSV